jgi:hemoglobin-like flavoprotein
MIPDHETAIRASLAEVTTQADAVAARFQARLTALDPDVRALFVATNSDTHVRGLAHLLKELADSLDDPERLVGVLVPLGRRHATYGVREEQFALAGDALVEALRETLDGTFTAEVESAWREWVELVVAVMRRAMHPRG